MKLRSPHKNLNIRLLDLNRLRRRNRCIDVLCGVCIVQYYVIFHRENYISIFMVSDRGICTLGICDRSQNGMKDKIEALRTRTHIKLRAFHLRTQSCATLADYLVQRKPVLRNFIWKFSHAQRNCPPVLVTELSCILTVGVADLPPRMIYWSEIFALFPISVSDSIS